MNQQVNISNNRRGQWAYKMLAILLPFVVLLLIELIMRWCGYGYDTSLFIEDKTGKYFLLNPDLSKKYFTIGENATIGNFEFFNRKKQPGTIRIFVLGASSSLGYPYMHNGAFPRMLKYRLQFAYPHTNFEIVNLSLTAVNSYTLYDFSKQLINYEPDAILVYAGHNEYYGALGVASTGRIGSNPKWVRATLSAKKLKIVQWAFAVAAKLRGTDKRITDYSRTLMERMTEEQSIPYRSKLFMKGIEQYDVNMGDMLRLFDGQHIPVFIGTLVSNQRSMKPFVSSADSLDATKQFALGNKAYNQGNYSAAKGHYIKAKEYDELRFRAPEAINEIIRKHAGQLKQVRLVDVLETFEAHSPNAIPDSTLLLEHVHPNLAGHRLIADTFYQALETSELLPANHDMEFMRIIEDYPYTAFDTLFGKISILLLKELWPFNEPLPEEDPQHVKSFEEQVAGANAVKQIDWYAAMEQLYKHYEQNGDKRNALRVMEGMCLDSPYNGTYFQQAGKLCMQQDDALKAWFYFTKMDALGSSPDAASNIAVALLKLDMPDKAIPYLDKAIRDENTKVDLRPMKEVAEEIVLLKQQLLSAPGNDSLRKAIAAKYQIIGNSSVAAKYLLPPPLIPEKP